MTAMLGSNPHPRVDTILRERYERWLQRELDAGRLEIRPHPLAEYGADPIEAWAEATGHSGLDVQAVLDSYASSM